MSLRVTAYPTSGAYSRDLFPPGNPPVTESGGGTETLTRWEHDRERTLLADARLCSLLLDSDLGGWEELQVGGVVVTILTSEGPVVRTHLRPRISSPCSVPHFVTHPTGSD